MKKIVICILCLSLLMSFTGCLQQQPNDANSTTADNTPATNDSTTPDNSANSNPAYDFGKTDGEYTVNAYMEYLTFEDACELATDVVVATFTGCRPYGAATEFSFTVKERLLGNAPEQINVYVMGTTVFVDDASVGNYNQQEMFLYHNTDYLLVLDHRVSIYNEVDIYQFICNIAIDVSNIESGKMYNQPISAHSSKFDFSKADAQTTITYIQNLVKNNTPSAQPVKDPSTNEIMSTSTDVVVVRVNKCDKEVITNFRDTGFYSCTVTETLKGSIPSGETIEILFRNADVSEGDVIIVALNNYDQAIYYRLTSLNSIFSVNQKDAIASLIQNQ